MNQYQEENNGKRAKLVQHPVFSVLIMQALMNENASRDLASQVKKPSRGQLATDIAMPFAAAGAMLYFNVTETVPLLVNIVLFALLAIGTHLLIRAQCSAHRMWRAFGKAYKHSKALTRRTCNEAARISPQDNEGAGRAKEEFDQALAEIDELKIRAIRAPSIMAVVRQGLFSKTPHSKLC